MSSMAIGIGLTHIRKYSYVQKGFFYSGLLSFTSGIERLGKIILIYDYRLDHNDDFPNNKHIRNYSHKLEKLIGETRKINARQAINLDDAFFDSDLLYRRLFSFLADFADQARYYDLDYLTGKKQSSAEPLARWDKEICSEIIRRHYRPNRKRVALKQELAKRMESETSTSVSYTREDGTEIENVAELFAHDDLVPIKQKYSMCYLYIIARFLSTLCIKLEHKGDFLPPFLEEFFGIFMNPDPQYVLRKRTWIP